MGWAEEFAAKTKAQAAQERVAAVDGPVGWVTGFGASAISSIPEMFGQNPSETAARFRAENPVSGIASEMIGMAVPYLGAAKISSLPRAAAALDGVMARTGLTALENPIAYGAVKEVARFAPLELGRLGIGLATDDGRENFGDLLADVGLSVALTGGFGAIGGFFRSGGKVDPVGVQDNIVGTDFAFRDTFKLRSAMEPGALTQSGAPVADIVPQLTRNVLMETPETALKGQQKWVSALEGGTPEADAAINSLWKGGARNKGYRNQLLLEGAEGDARTLNAGEQEAFVQSLGFQSVDELAASTVYPRRINVATERGAGDLSKKLEASALQPVGDGTWMAREANDGLFVIAKRVRAGEIEDGAKAVGALRVAPGDQWLVAKTDRPNLFAPQAHKATEVTTARWAQLRGAWAPSMKTDPVNKAMDMVAASLSPQDARDLVRTGRVSGVSKIADNLGKRFAAASGLEGSATLRAMADWTYDIVKPAMFQEAQNPLFGRLFALQRAAFRTMDDTVNRLIGGKVVMRGTPSEAIRGKNIAFESGFEGNRPIQQIVQELSDEEAHLVALAAQAEMPAEALQKLAREGAISPRAAAAVEELQKINRDYVEKVFLPSIDGTVVQGQFKPLEGYVIPRVWDGEWRAEVLNELGKPVWIGSGKNAALAKQQADMVVAEAQERGLNWSRGNAKHLVQGDKDAANVLEDFARDAFAKSRDVQEIVQAATTKTILARSSLDRVPRVRQLGGFAKERTSTPGSPDVRQYTKDDLIAASESHYKNMGRVAAYHAWQQRWGQEAFNLEKIDKTLYTNLMRKANQQLGIEGQITQTLNKTLTPVLGHVLGGKAATRIAQGTNALMYNWNLAIANPTFALLNLLQPLQTVAPWISFVTRAPSEEVARYMQFVPRYGADGLPRGQMGFLHPMKVLGEATRLMRQPTSELKQVLEQLKTEGSLSAQLYEGWVGGKAASHMTIREVFDKQGAWPGIKKIATFMAEKSEEYSRMVSANAAYIVGRDFFRMEGDQLLNFVRQGVRVTNYGYGVVDRSRLFTGPVGSMFGLFKNWQFHYIGQMMQYANLGMTQGVWGPLMWQGATALAVGGLGATPLKMLADGLATWATDAPSSYLWMQENWQDSADEIYFGLPALLGGSLQASSTMPGTDVRQDISNLSNFVFIERAKAAGKAVGAAWDLANGADMNPLRDDKVVSQLMGAFAPRAIFRAYSGIEGEFIRSMSTGYPQIRGLSASSQMLHMAGFNQLEVERQQVAARELFKSQESERSLIASLGQAYAGASEAQDWEEMQRVLDRAQLLSVPLSSVMKSADTRQRREEEGSIFSRYDKAAVARYKTALNME